MSVVKSSPEVLAVSRRWIEAIRDQKPNNMRNLMSEKDHVLFIGTGENEIWQGAAVKKGVAGFFGVIPNFLKHDEVFAEAYEQDGTGWACFEHEIIFDTEPDRSFIVRSTLILTLEEGAWKIVHRHGSVPIPNLDFTGVDQNAIADLVAAAKQGFALDQNEGFATVMFTDIVNSSNLATVLGDRLWSSEVTKHFALLRSTIESAGGQFVKSLGDGTMSSFSSVSSALNAARTIMQQVAGSDGPAITLRIGLNSGDVVQTDDDFFGTVVNEAARITALAAPSEIRLSDTTRMQLSDAGGHSFSDQKTVELKGLPGQHLIHRLEWQD